MIIPLQYSFFSPFQAYWCFGELVKVRLFFNIMVERHIVQNIMVERHIVQI